MRGFHSDPALFDSRGSASCWWLRAEYDLMAAPSMTRLMPSQLGGVGVWRGGAVEGGGAEEVGWIGRNAAARPLLTFMSVFPTPRGLVHSL